MTVTRSRTWQWLAIIVAFLVLGGGYWYFSARAGVKQGAPLGGPAPGSLVGYWSFDGDDISGTTAYDRSGSGNNGTLTNGPTTATGIHGQALSFDGTDDYVTTTSSDTLRPSQITLSAWVKIPTGYSGNRQIASRGFNSGYRYRIDTGRTVSFFDRGATNSCTTVATVLVNEWTHIVAIGSSTGLSIYINGVLGCSNAVPYGNGSVVNPFQIGYDSGGSDLTFLGSIDEVRIYNTALTAAQVYDLYKLGGETVGASTPTRDSLNEGLAGYWKLDDASGTTATDSSTNGNNGTLTNGPTWGTGQIGGGGVFDGTDDYINVGTAPNIANKSFTISTWTKRNTTGVAHWLISQGSGSAGNGLHFGFLSNNKVRCSFYNSAYDLDTPSFYTDSNWHLWTCTYDADSNTKKIFQDGVFLVSGTVPSDYAGSGALKVGAFLDGTTVLNGQLDEVRVYNRALSAEEITRLYKTTTPSNPDTRLKGYWSFDGDSISGTTARDLSGSGNNGTLTNSPTVSEGVRGQALSFFPNGADTNAYINVSSSSTLDFGTGDYSVAFWAKSSGYVNQGSGYNALVVRGNTVVDDASNAYSFYIPSTSKITFLSGNGTSSSQINASQATVNDSQWHHYVGLRQSGSSLKLYIDGVLIGSNTLSGSLPTGANFQIGGVGSSRNFNGSIDEIRIYNAALSASEIYNLYQEGSVKVNKAQNNNGDSLNDGLAGYWKLDDASGTTATDSSGNGNNGTLTNGPAWGTGQIGGAVTFDGTDDWIAVPYNSVLNPTYITVSAWIKTSTNGSPDSIVDRDDGAATRVFQFRVNGNSVEFITFADAGGLVTATGPKIVTDGNWHHVVGTWDGRTVLVYVDGIAGTGQSFSGILKQGTTGNLRIGDRLAGGYPFHGQIDETRFYNRALSAEEVARLYKTTSPGNPETGLVGYWSFNGKDLSGTTAYDRSGKGNNGTLTSGPTITEGRIGQAVNFDGVNDSIVTPSIAMDPANGRSFSAWFKINSLAAEANILNQNSTILNVRTDGSIRFYWTGGGFHYTSGITLTTGTWYHIVGVETTTSVSNYKIYINGTKYLDEDDPWTHYGGSGALTIGSNASAQYFPGVIDEVRAYTKSLSVVEVSNLYNFGR